MDITSEEYNSVRAAIDFISTQIDGTQNDELLQLHQQTLADLRTLCNKISVLMDKRDSHSIKIEANRLVKQKLKSK